MPQSHNEAGMGLSAEAEHHMPLLGLISIRDMCDLDDTTWSMYVVGQQKQIMRGEGVGHAALQG